MSDLIIDAPHLQTLQQRFGSFVVALVCWSLWLYFLIPIVTLSGWLLGFRKLSKEIRWFGGYKSLMELMVLYGETVLLIALAWLCWTLIVHFRRPPPKPQPQAVGNAELCQKFGVETATLERCQASRRVTVHFDEQGHIVGMDTPQAAADS